MKEILCIGGLGFAEWRRKRTATDLAGGIHNSDKKLVAKVILKYML